MAKVHYTGIPCGAKPFGADGGDLFIKDGNQITYAGWHNNFGYPPLPETNELTKVTCKRCQRILRKSNNEQI